jgi:hypothetical protein
MDDMKEKDNAPSGSNFKGGVYAGVARFSEYPV